MKDRFNHVYHALYSRENVYNRQPKMQARFSFLGKEFSFKDVDRKQFFSDPKNSAILESAYLANTEDLAGGVNSSNILYFIKQQELSLVNLEKADKTIADEFFLDVELDADKKTIKKAEKKAKKHENNTDVLDVAKPQLNYKLKFSEHIPQNCIGVVVVAVGAHNTLLGAKKHYRELIKWNKEHPDKQMGMIFFDYRGAGLSDNIAPEDLNSDQAIINDVKAVIKYASSLEKPLCLSGTCFGTGPVTGAVCQLSQECETDDDFQKTYNIKGILRSLEYSTFASVARKQQDYLKPFWHNIVATFGAPYRSATLTSLSNVHDVAYIPSSIPISTYQATRPRWTHEEPLTSKDFYSNNRDVKGFFGGMVESFFQSILLRPGDAMMGLEQAYKNWAIKDNPGRYLIDPTKSHSEGIGFTDEKLEVFADMFDYNCGQNERYQGAIKKDVEPEIVSPFSSDIDEDFKQKKNVLDILSKYDTIVQEINENQQTEGVAEGVAEEKTKLFMKDQSNVLRGLFEKIPQSTASRIISTIGCEDIFKDETKAFNRETFAKLIEELEKYQQDFGKFLRHSELKKLPDSHPLYQEIAQEFKEINKDDPWYKLFEEHEKKKLEIEAKHDELMSNIQKANDNLSEFTNYLTTTVSSLKLEKQVKVLKDGGIEEYLAMVQAISAKYTMLENELTEKGLQMTFYETQYSIKNLKDFLKILQPNAIAETQLKLQRDYSLTTPEEIVRIKAETKNGIKYYQELYQLKAILNPEKYVTEEARADFRKNKKDLKNFYQKILQNNIEYAIAGQFLKTQKQPSEDDFNEYKKTFGDIQNVLFENVQTKHRQLKELQQAEAEKAEAEKLYLKSSQGDLSPTGVHHQVDYGKHTPQEAFLKKVTDYDYMKQKVRKWDSKISSLTPNSTTKPGDVTCLLVFLVDFDKINF